MRRLTAARRAFLENPFVAVAPDLRSDGSPHSTVAWVVDPGDYAARTACTGGSFVAAVNQVLPASREPKTSPDVAPK